MNWKEKRNALIKMQNGEWEQDGDEALEQAKNFVGQDGEILGGEKETELSPSNSSGSSTNVEETIEMPSAQKK